MAFGTTATIHKSGEDKFGMSLGFVEVGGELPQDW